MKKIRIGNNTELCINNSEIGEMLETKIERLVTNGEQLKDTTPLIYTERGSGVQAGYNIRTDRFEIAVEASDRITKSYQARREERAGKVVKIEEVGEPKSIQGEQQSSSK